MTTELILGRLTHPNQQNALLRLIHEIRDSRYHATELAELKALQGEVEGRMKHVIGTLRHHLAPETKLPPCPPTSFQNRQSNEEKL